MLKNKVVAVFIFTNEPGSEGKKGKKVVVYPDKLPLARPNGWSCFQKYKAHTLLNHHFLSLSLTHLCAESHITLFRLTQFQKFSPLSSQPYSIALAASMSSAKRQSSSAPAAPPPPSAAASNTSSKGEATVVRRAKRFAAVGDSVWIRIARLAAANKAADLGQGMPNFPITDFIKKSMVCFHLTPGTRPREREGGMIFYSFSVSFHVLLFSRNTAPLPPSQSITHPPPHTTFVRLLFILLHSQQVSAVEEDFNQYSPATGHPELVSVLAPMYSERLGHKLTAANITVCNGASETLAAAVLSLIDPGDEVIVIEPFFDLYSQMIVAAGGVPVYLTLKPSSSSSLSSSSSSSSLPSDSSGFTISDSDLRTALASPKAKMLLLNSPHNPTGKVFSADELKSIGAAVKAVARPELVVMSDEVYEHLVYDSLEHVPFIKVNPELWERTLTVCSAGKTFGATGWKTGWALGPASLIQGIFYARQATTFTVNSPTQVGIGRALAQTTKGAAHDTYFSDQRALYGAKRDRILAIIKEATGAPLTTPQGSYFILMDLSSLHLPSAPTGAGRSEALAKHLIETYKVAAIPMDPFLRTQTGFSIYSNTVRLCFAKSDDTLDSVKARLEPLKAALKKK